MKNLAPDEYHDLVESGHITPEMAAQMYSEAAHGSGEPRPTFNMGSIRRSGSQFPESQPMPNQKELLQTVMQQLQNPVYKKNMELILNKPVGEKAARHAMMAYENESNPEAVPDHMVMGKDVSEDTY